MFVKYTIIEEIIIPADLYTSGSIKAIKHHIFAMYLFKIVSMKARGEFAQGICVKIESIEVKDNIILRKTADIKVKLEIEMLVLRLLPDQYYEGIVAACHSEGVNIKFINGLLQGVINMRDMHRETIYNEERNQWILLSDGEKGYEWKVGAEVRFRIGEVIWKQLSPSQQPKMIQLISLKANEPGLGPVQWWI